MPGPAPDRPDRPSLSHALIALVIVLSVGAAFALPRLRVETDLNALLPAGSPAAAAYETYLERFGGFEKVFIVITSPWRPQDEEEAEDLTVDLLDAARLLAEELSTSSEVAAVRAGLREEDERFFLEHVLPRVPLLLGEDWRRQVTPRLEAEAIRRRVAELEAALKTPTGDVTVQLAVNDPLGFSAGFGQGGPFSLPIDLLSSGFLAADGSASLVMLTPSGAEIDPEGGRRLRTEIEAAAERVEAEVGRELTFGAVGGPLYAAHDEELLRGDLQQTMSGSLAICTLLLLTAFAGWRLPAVCLAALGLGFLWTAGWLALLVERISAVGLGFAAVLVGLGLDYAIHGGARFRQERLGGLAPRPALIAARRHAGGAILASALTTAAAFSTLTLAHFRPLREIGLLVAGGILTLLLATALLAMILQQRLSTDPEAGPEPAVGPVWTMLGRLADGSVELSRRRPLPVLALAGVLTVAGAWGISGLSIDPDLRALRPAGHPLEAIEDQLAESFDLGSETTTVLIHGADRSEALERAARVDALLREALGPDAEGALSSPTDWMVAGSQVEARLAAFEELPFAAAADLLERELRAANLNPAAFANGLDALRAYSEGRDPSPLDAVERPDWLDELIREDQDGTWLALRLRLPEGVWDGGPPAALIERAAAAAPGTRWASAPLLGAELRDIATADAERLDSVALIGVLLVVLIAFRGRPRPALLALVPVGLGTLWTLGLWAGSGRSLDLISLSVLPILLGIGVDDGLHALHGSHRGRRAGPGDARAGAPIAENIHRAGRAMTLTTLTTAAAFGSLALSEVPGLRAGGKIVALGVLACWVATLWVLPATESVLDRSRKRRGDPPQR